MDSFAVVNHSTQDRGVLYWNYNHSAPSMRVPYGYEEMEAMRTTIHTLKKVAPPVLIMLGTIGNSLGIAALHKSPVFRKSSVCYYLRAFFVSSILVLYLGAGLDWLSLMTGLPHLWDVTDGLCRIWYFFSSVIFFSPIWFCVAIILDRYVSVCHQRSAGTLCTVFMSKVVIISVQIGLILVSIHAMWTYELHATNVCWTPTGRQDFHSIVWPWVSVVIYTFLPLSILLLFNIVLFVGLCHRHTCQKPEPNSRQATSDRSKLTVAALAVTTAYVTLALPATVMNVYMSQAPPSWIAATPESYYRHELLGEIFQQLAIFNHAAMFIVCFCSSRIFREETYKIFIKEKQRPGIELTVDEENPCKYRPKNGSLPDAHRDISQL